MVYPCLSFWGCNLVTYSTGASEGENMEKAQARGKGRLAERYHARMRSQRSQIFQDNLGGLGFFKCEVFLILNLVTNSN